LAVVDASRLSYWTPVQIKLYTDVGSSTRWIDDAAGIDFQIQDQKTPHFGFRDRYFRTVSHNRTIVSGNLYINFRYPNYLSHAIVGSFQKAEGPSPFGKSKIPDITKSPSLATSVGDVGVSLMKDLLVEDLLRFRSYVADLKKMYYGGGDPNQTPGVNEKRPGELQTQDSTGTFNIKIQYGDEHLDATKRFTQELQGVYLTGTGHRATMFDGNGDRNIIEIYPFFARNLRVVSQA
jgi:hypothetical protein